MFHEERLADVEASAAAAQLPPGRIRIDDRSGFGDLLATSLSSISPDSREPWPAHGEADPCFIYFTSGSTGKPKGVTHSRASFGAILASLVQATELEAGEEVVAGGSLAHIASSTLALAALSTGAAVVIADAIDSPTLETLLRRHRPVVMLMLPAALFGLVRDQRLLPTDLQSIRLCISGGDKIPHQLQEEFSRASGFGIDECYGMSEIGSVGLLCPGFSACLRNEDGDEVAIGKEGRLWMQAPSQEEALEEHPAVDLVGVVGIQDPVHGENVRAYVTLRPDQPAPGDDELIAFARARVGYKAPEEIRFLDAMPPNAVGKTDRLVLRQLAADSLHAS